jgi:glycogen synthase
MLGWEFPPILAGGLGQACHDLFQAMSPYVDMTVVLPRSDKEVRLSKIKFIGLNQYGASELEKIKLLQSAPELKDVLYVPVDFSPYPSVEVELQEAPSPIEVSPEHTISITTPTKTRKEVRQLYTDKEPYGNNILEKVATYSQAVEAIARRTNFDIIHAHDWITFPAAVKIKEATGKPLVVHIHSLETDRTGANTRSTVYDIEHSAMVQADCVVPVSQYTKQCILEHYPDVNPDKIMPVHNALSEEVTPYRTEKNIADKIVVFLGRITVQKGPGFLLDVAERVIQKYPDVKFVVAGTGDLFVRVLEEAATRRLGNKFIFTGYLPKDKVGELLAQADVYVMPSQSEPFGLSALEAAKYGIPCVISRQSGVAEIMKHALKADYGDVKGFANYIYALLKYDSLRSEIIENSKQELAHLNWDASARDIVQIYHNLLT